MWMKIYSWCNKLLTFDFVQLSPAKNFLFSEQLFELKCTYKSINLEVQYGRRNSKFLLVTSWFFLLVLDERMLQFIYFRHLILYSLSLPFPIEWLISFLLPVLQLIDLTIKKKKKKKTFDLDAALGEGHDEPMDTNTTPDKENLEPSAAMEDFDGSFDFSK